MVSFPKAQAARRSNCIAPVIEYIIGVKKYASNKMKIITKEEMFQSLLLFHFLHADVRKMVNVSLLLTGEFLVLPFRWV